MWSFMKHYSFNNVAVSLAGTDAAREFLDPIFADRDRELLIVALCDERVRLLQLLSYPGTADEVPGPFHPIMRCAVKIGCAGLIIAHNHPSGDTRPSAFDIAITRRFVLAAESIGIALLDHIVFDSAPPFSFRQAGFL